MKKRVLFFLILLLCLPAADCLQEEEFLFRDRIAWGSAMDETAGQEDGNTEKWTLTCGLTMLTCYNVPIGRYSGGLNYLFDSDSLVMAVVGINDPSEEKYRDLLETTKAEYGDETGRGYEDFLTLLRYISPEAALNDSELHEFTSGQTSIWLCMESYDSQREISILYVSPQFRKLVEENAGPKIGVDTDGP